MARLLPEAGAEGGADREVNRQDPVLEVEVRARREQGMVVWLQQVVGRQTRLDAASEIDDALPLGRDHLVQDALDLAGVVGRGHLYRPAGAGSGGRGRAPSRPSLSVQTRTRLRPPAFAA